MKSLYGKIAAFILMAGLLSACGTQATATLSASQPTEAAASVPAAPTNPPTATNSSASPVTQPAGQSPQGATVSFAKDVLPILHSRCTTCHGGERTEKGLNLTTYDSLMTGSENGPVVTPGNAADSQFVEMIVNQKMPKRGPKLTPSQVQLITDWVNQGALNN
jgi:hypothetical protein